MFDFSWLLTLDGLVVLVILMVLELVLAVDNLLLIAIATARLPEAQKRKAIRLGLFLAMFMRIGLLLCISWIMGLTEKITWLPAILGHHFTGKELFLLLGGVFLIYKATTELFHHSEAHHGEGQGKKATSSFTIVIIQILFMDLIFSLDSLLGAVGLTQHISLIGLAIIVTVGAMFIIAEPVTKFINENPSIKTLGLAFVLMIGVLLTGEGIGYHFPKGMLYFGLGFSIFIEVINIRRRQKLADQKQQAS